MFFKNLLKATMMALETGTTQAETDIPLITEDDYGKPLLPVHLKTEAVRTHSFEAIHPVKPVVCIGHKCPLCDAKFYRDTERLLPVYSMEDGVVKILRLPLVMHPSSLYHVMGAFIADKARDQGLFYRTPFVIRFKGHTDGRIGAYGLEQDALFEIQSKEPLQDRDQIEARGDCVSRFLKRYKPGDLTKSANIHVSEKVMKIGLEKSLGENPESLDIADFMDSMPDFGAKPKRIGKFF